MRKTLLLIMIAVFFAIQLFSQNIEGIVTNTENKNPVPDAHIVLKNSTQGTVTDRDGFFSLEINKDKSYIIRISCVGFETQEMVFNTHEKTEKLNIQLRPISVQLNRNIVISASKKELVAIKTPDAVSVLTAEDLKINAPRSMAEALIGVSGVWMQKTNHGGGSPFVRGFTGNQTLLLIDGIRLNNATFRYGPNQYFNTIDVFFG